MYPTYLHSFFPAIRLAALFALFLLGTIHQGYGQRVYADAQQNSHTALLASVTNPSYPIDNDTLNHSTLTVAVGLVGLVSAQQNLQFVNAAKPTPNSPLIIKFSTPGSLLDLLGGFSAQRTNNNTFVPPAYGGAGLLNLLNLFGGGNIATLVIPPTGVQFDGIRLTINTTLGLGRQANYYYAFYITPPQLSHSVISICEGEASAITITNFQSGYTYRLYDAQTGGNQIIATNTDTAPISSSLGVGDYWLEARENVFYPSARVMVTVTVHSKPGTPHTNIIDILH